MLGDSVRCWVCGWGLPKKDLKLFLNTSRSGTPYKGEPDFGHCGTLLCQSEGQARLDMESINSCLDTIPELWELSGQDFVKAYRNSAAPTFTVAQMCKKARKAQQFYEEELVEVEFDQGWCDNHWQ